MARTIASLPAGVAAAAKEALDAAEASGAVPTLTEGDAAHDEVYTVARGGGRPHRVVMDHGGQTRTGELGTHPPRVDPTTSGSGRNQIGLAGVQDD